VSVLVLGQVRKVEDGSFEMLVELGAREEWVPYATRWASQYLPLEGVPLTLFELLQLEGWQPPGWEGWQPPGGMAWHG
jgi:hypothetical protein